MTRLFIFLIPFILVSCSKEQTKSSEIKVIESFLTNNSDQQENWFDEQVKSMNLSTETNESYRIIVAYHVLKMKQLSKKDLNKEELKREFPKQIRKLSKDASKYLNKNQLKVHDQMWNSIASTISIREKW